MRGDRRPRSGRLGHHAHLGPVDADNDFGNWQTATKTGMKFHDLNADGVKEAGEPGLAGWTITAYADRTATASATPARTRSPAPRSPARAATYSLSLGPGKYIVCETQQAGWTQSYPANTLRRWATAAGASR